MASAAGQPPLVFLGSNHWHCLDPALQGSLGSDHGPEGHRGWGPSGLLKLPLQLLPAPTNHQEVYVPFHKEVVPACPAVGWDCGLGRSIPIPTPVPVLQGTAGSC